MRFRLTLAAIVLLSASPAFGQYVRVIQACSRDVKQFCAAAQPGGGHFVDCIEANFDSFSAQCQTALARIAAVRAACRADIRHQCPAARPGGGRIFLCVKRHFPELSKACKDAIGHTAESQLRTMERHRSAL